MKKQISVIGIWIITTLAAWTAPSINQDVYDYDWMGRISNLNGDFCLDWSKWTEWYKVGVAPYGKAQRTYQYWNQPACGNAVQTAELYQWHDAALNTPAVKTSWSNQVCVATNNYYGTDYMPKRLTEMANYVDKTVPGSNYKFTRNAFGKTRFWMNGATNGLYHVRVTFTGGYWQSWWPGDFQPGDVEDLNTPDLALFNYAADNVRIQGILLDSLGQATFYWNPYGGATLDCTPTVGNVTKKQHWWYWVNMEIIP